MKKSKLLLTILTVILFTVLLCFTASAETEGYYTYTVENGEATITDVDESISGDVVIPDTLGGYPVKVIGDGAFSHCSSLTNVTIGNGVTIIGEEAFSYCNDLTSVIIPDGVTSIGDYAFCGCSKLTSIELSDSITEIGNGAFESCERLVSINIPSNLITIESMVFTCCFSLDNIVIPDNVKRINDYAFHCCGIKNISIGSGTSYIDDMAIHECYVLESISVDENNPYYASEDGVLFNKDKTKLIRYPSKKSDVTYHIPETVKEIADEAFNLNFCIKEIFLPKSLEVLGAEAFFASLNIEHIYFYGENTKITPESFVLVSPFNYEKWLEHREEFIPLFWKAFDPSITEEEINRYGELENMMGSETLVPYGTIHGYAGSTAEAYAKEYGINFELLPTSVTDKETDVNVEFKPDVFPEGTVMLIDKKGQNADGTFNGKYEYYESFDISFVDAENKEVQPNGTVTVRIPVPHKFNPEKTVVYYLAPDGTATKLESWHEGKYIVFEVNHFSEYVIVDESSEIVVTPEPEEPEEPAEKLNLFEKLIAFLTDLFNFIKNLFE